MAHPASVRIEAPAKPVERAENARGKGRVVGREAREEIIRYAKYHRMRNLPGEISAYVVARMHGRYCERTIDRVILEFAMAEERKARTGLSALQNGVRMVFDAERQTRREFEGVA